MIVPVPEPFPTENAKKGHNNCLGMQKNQQHMKKFHSNIPFAFNAINPTNLTVSNFGSEKNLKSETQIPYCTYSILVTINTYDHKQQLRKHIIGPPLDYLNLIQFHKKNRVHT